MPLIVFLAVLFCLAHPQEDEDENANKGPYGFSKDDAQILARGYIERLNEYEMWAESHFGTIEDQTLWQVCKSADAFFGAGMHTAFVSVVCTFTCIIFIQFEQCERVILIIRVENSRLRVVCDDEEKSAVDCDADSA